MTMRARTRSFLVAVVVLGMGLPAQAWGPRDPDQDTTFSFSVQRAPKGTVCGATGAIGKVKTSRFMGGAVVSIRGSAHVGDVSCALPDGRRISTALNKTGVAQHPEAYRIHLSVDPKGRAAGIVEVWTRRGQFQAFLPVGEGYGVD